MSLFSQNSLWRLLFASLALAMMGLLVAPLLGLLMASSPKALLAGLRHPLFWPALWLSTRTTLGSLLLVISLGTPLAWWLANHPGRRAKALALLIDLPIVLPPAVLGIAMLYTFGRNGLFGPLLAALKLQIPFTTTAVVLAQVLISAPFYIQSAVAAFRRVDKDLLLVARSLGQSQIGAFFRVAVPLARPGLLAGAALAWARALGEFGATLLFAGNLANSTQTMPLAIYTALESDVRVALALSLCLASLGVLLLFGLRMLPRFTSPSNNATSNPWDWSR